MKRLLVALVAMACWGSALPACKTLEKSAAQDPMKCERDPKCNKKRDKSADCSTQCNDDPACMDRCAQVQAPNGPLGH
jgi:hypothetical protein